MRHLKNSGALLVALLATFSFAHAQITAFPGAQGFGAYATGGRGGDVYTVVNLNSSGAGSLNYGIQTAPASGRTIVFAVSGYIPIVNNSDTGDKTVRIVQNKVTIAGQTAPGDGIGLKDGRILMTGNNLVLRHLRVRHGKYGGAGDCINLENTADNSIIDHVSLMFSTDENISFFNSTVDNFTLQNSVSTWGMERHNAGGLWDLQDGTCHHTLWAHHRTRNPKARPFNGVLEWINNVTYDWRSEGFIMGDSQTPANWSANVRGCYYLSIQDYEFGTDNTPLSKARIASDGLPNFHLYLDNCLHDSNTNGLLDGIDKGYSIVSGQPYNPAEGAAPGTERYDKSAVPFTGATGTATVIIDPPLTAYKKVLSSSGALRLDATYAGPLRDELDSLLIQSVEDQESILIAKDTPRPEYGTNDPPSNGEAQLAGPPYNISNNGFGTLNTAPAPLDWDLDGMPDFWENSLGWSTNSQDHNTALANSGGFVTGLTFFPSNTVAGFTRLEEYLHFKAIPHATIEKNTTNAPSSLTVDLRRYVRGFNKAPVTFTLSNVTNGTAVLQPNGYTVVFTPTLDYFGRARFDFTVTDGDGSTWTQTLGVLVSGFNVPRNLKWKGDGTGNQWNTNALNFLNSTNPVAFAPGDNALFDDTGSNSPAINLTADVSPSSIEVSATKNYTFAGVGALSGAGPLLKSGSGTLTMATTNSSFAGSIDIEGGTLALNSGTSIGSGAVTIGGGATFALPGSGSSVTVAGPVSVPAGESANITSGLLSSGFSGNFVSGDDTSVLNLTGGLSFGGTSSSQFDGFTGTINLNPGATLRFSANSSGNTYGSLNPDFVINGTLQPRNAGNTVKLGALNGSGTLAGPQSNSGAGNTTYNVGANNANGIFSGVISSNTAVAGSLVGLTKLGTGSLTLGGNNTYSGNTLVGAGTLLINGNNGPSPVIVSNAATLGGTGTISGLVTANAGSKLAPGNSAGTLTLAGGLTLNSAALNFELANVTTPGSGVNDLIAMSGGTLTLSGTSVVNPIFLNGSLAIGTYTLISGGSSTVGTAANLSWGGGSGGRQTFTFNTATPGTVQLVVGGSPAASLVWRGLVNTNWDLTSSNWLNAAVQDKFFNVDTATFDDTGLTKPLVNFTTSVAPAAVTVNSTGSYTFSGAAGLTGTGTFTKTGAGTLNFNLTNSSFAGDVLISGGTLNMQGAGSKLNTGNLILGGGGTFNFPPSSPAYFYGGSITVPAGQSGTIYSPGLGNGINGNLISGDSNSVLYISSGVSFGSTSSAQFDSFTGTINILPGATLRFSPNSSGNTYGSLNPTFIINGSLRPRNAGNTIRLGALSGTGSIEGPQTANTGSGNTTYIIGGNNLDVTFNGNISSNNAASNTVVILNKVGTGKLVLVGASTFTGGTTVSAGSLFVNNISGSGTGSGALTIATGATLGGTGRIGSATTLDDYATLAPGNSTGTLTFDGSLTLGEFTELDFQLGTSSDLVVCNGALSLDGVLNVTNGPGFGPGTYTLFTYNPANGFSYSGVSLDSVPAGYNYTLSTATPGQVNLVVSATAPPTLGTPVYSGGNLILSGTGGTPGANYYVLTSTNVALPMTSWTTLATNQFDGSGNFAFTNAVSSGTPRLFYRIQVP